MRTIPGALLLIAVLLSTSGLVMWLADPMHWFRGATEETTPPVAVTPGGGESPAQTTESAAVPIRTVTVGALRFEIVGDRSAAGTFAAALRSAAAPLVDPDFAEESSKLAGRIIRIELAASRVSPVTHAGLPWQSCRMTASCRVGTATELGNAEGVHAHADGAAACDGAAEKLAEAIIDKLAQHLQEEESI